MKKIGLFLAAALVTMILGAMLLPRKGPSRSRGSALPPPHTPSQGSVSNFSALAQPPVATQRPSALTTNLFDALSADAVERKPQIDRLVEGMSLAERIKALDELWSDDLKDAKGPRYELVGELLRKWAEEMPQAAAEWVDNKPVGPMQREASRNVAIIWANQSLSEAAAWVRRWPEEEKEAGLLAVAYEAIRTAPKEALSLASELTPAQTRNALISQAVREWASNDASVPIAWGEQMESSDLREQVFAAVAISLSETDPAGAANLALKRLGAGERQNDTVVSIVQRWAQSAPQAAGNWVVQFPEGEVRDAAVENLVQLWANKDANQAADWLDRIEDGSIRDAGLTAFSQALAPKEPEVAIAWAEAISDPTVRQRQIDAVASVWTAADPEAANAWRQSRSEINAALSRAPLH